MDGQDVLGHKISVSLLEPRGRNRRYNDDDQNENIVLDPQRRSLMMRHIAENKNDKGLIDMMNRVNHTVLEWIECYVDYITWWKADD